ncbi:hypothetical protein D3C75_557190 [compost metagenome]
MKKTGLIVSGVVAVALIFFIMVSWSHYKTLVSLEEQTNAQLTANKSNYDNMWKSFKEMTQVTDLQAEQFKETYTELISGRYQDTNLLFKMVQEQNPQLDASVYTKLQNQIAAGRKEFDNNQKKIADIIREYNYKVRTYIVVSAITSKDALDSSKYIVTSDKTSSAFETNKDDVIDLTGN